jgi:serine protein kinase
VTSPDAPRPESTTIALTELDQIAGRMERRFQEGRRLLSFQQYLQLFAESPVRHGRDASRYVRDMFDHFGTRTVKKPWGELTRFRLFDLPWDQDGAAPAHRAHAARDAALVGQEDLQAEIYRCLENFVQEGRAQRVCQEHHRGLHSPRARALLDAR